NPVHISAASGPVKGTGPNEIAAVSCSERCSRGLLPTLSISGVSKFGGRRGTTRAALASDGTRWLHWDHQAMSGGVTKAEVVHHGSARPSCVYQSANWAAIRPSTRQP